MVAGLGAIAAIMVPNVFGANWNAAVPLLEIISLTAFTTCLYQFTYSILLTTDRASIYPRLTIIQLLITVVLLVPATRLGLAAIGWAYVMASLLTAIIHLAAMRVVLRISFSGLLMRLSSVAVATIAMVLMVLWLGREMSEMSPWIILPSQIALGALVYVGVLFAVARSDANQLTSTVVDLAFNR
jgi:O-antigen/teichoic acid export membrane protein